MIKRKRVLVLVIGDNHPSHRAKTVSEERPELHFLPPCSPQPNPDEQVWDSLKNHALVKRGFRLAEPMWRMVHPA